MGFYINPTKGTKEEWLITNGILAPKSRIDWREVPTSTLPVILINNGFFRAAGIAYNDRELEAFQDPDDSRPREVYFVTIEKLIKICPEFRDFAEQRSIIV